MAFRTQQGDAEMVSEGIEMIVGYVERYSTPEGHRGVKLAVPSTGRLQNHRRRLIGLRRFNRRIRRLLICPCSRLRVFTRSGCKRETWAPSRMREAGTILNQTHRRLRHAQNIQTIRQYSKPIPTLLRISSRKLARVANMRATRIQEIMRSAQLGALGGSEF